MNSINGDGFTTVDKETDVKKDWLVTYCNDVFHVLNQDTEAHLRSIETAEREKFSTFEENLKADTDKRINDWKTETLQKQNIFVQTKRADLRRSLQEKQKTSENASKERMDILKKSCTDAKAEMELRVKKRTEQIGRECDLKFEETKVLHREIFHAACGKAETMRKSLNQLFVTTEFETEKTNLISLENNREMAEKLMDLERARHRALLETNWVEEKQQILAEYTAKQENENKQLGALQSKFLEMQMELAILQEGGNKQIMEIERNSHQQLRESLNNLKRDHDVQMVKVRNVSFEVGKACDEDGTYSDRSFEMSLPNDSFEEFGAIASAILKEHEEIVEQDKADLSGFHEERMSQLEKYKNKVGNAIGDLGKK
jgi:hypothetical protein